MAQINQIGRVSIPNADFTYKNYTGSDIPEGTALKLDPSNNGGGGTAARGVIQTTSDVGCIGFAATTIKAGGTGQVQRLGVAVGIAGGTIAVGDWLMSNASGQVVAQTAGKEAIGRAEQAAVVTDRVALFMQSAKNA